MLIQTKTETKPLANNAQSDHLDASFDVAVGLPPKTTELGSDYFSEYIKEVNRTGKTPF
ncbi:hypothetical protein H6G33_36565 [Calothrix sp. FACHB-1219]|uniref:hypothetical protein n=1 Tax=unclassified Calothrix TaxID=2619626 RepID=UPI001683F716|nr:MULTISPECIES: hypothetical protein [unclassified Calothrix]MBD2207818.1 hypothetical protein [Calothrix sp. FACHB-168]MBD2222446.1 hypothetical protein [Calothrix sp. FACHB-1219]